MGQEWAQFCSVLSHWIYCWTPVPDLILDFRAGLSWTICSPLTSVGGHSCLFLLQEAVNRDSTNRVGNGEGAGEGGIPNKITYSLSLDRTYHIVHGYLFTNTTVGTCSPAL